MKRLLPGVTAAVAGVAFAFSASAADDMMEGLSLSGSINQDIGFGSYRGQAATADDVHMDHDATITFSASGQTDGGLGAKATIALKGKGDGVIDAGHLDITGAFGAINLGHNSHASNMHGNKGIGGGYGGTGYYDGSETYTPAMQGGPPGNDKGVGIRYSTPSIGGFQAGVSFQPEAGATVTTGAMNDTNVVAVGANFSGDFAGTSLTLGAGMVSRDEAGDTTEDWGIGATFGIGDTALNLRYDTDGQAMGDDKTSFGVGVDHTIGTLTFGIGVGVLNSPNAGGMADTESTTVAVGGKYDLGGGVALSAAINAGDVDAPGTAGDMDDVGVGLRMAFSF